MRKKQITAVLLCLLLTVCMLPTHIVKAEENKDGAQQAVAWLLSGQNEDGTWGDTKTCNDTCNAYALLRYKDENPESTYLNAYEPNNQNTDELAHLLWATGESDICHILLQQQNADGGFGLTEKYISEVYDSALAMMALVSAEYLYSDYEYGDMAEQALEKVITYISGQQNGDGGFSYNEGNESNAVLSAEIGIALSATSYDMAELYGKLDSYCLNAYTGDFSEESFAEQVRLARYLCKRGLIPDVEQTEYDVMEVQAENGSIYERIDDTIQYVLLLDCLSETQLPKQVSLRTTAETYVLEAGEEQTVTLTTDVSYETNRRIDGQIVYSLTEDGREAACWKEVAVLTTGQTMVSVPGSFTVTARKDAVYELQIVYVLPDQEETLATELIKFTVHEEEKKNLVLSGEEQSGEDYGIRLSWNDISTGDNRYGYRVFRRKNDNEWESRSTWDGEEKVKVLNVFPTWRARNYLVDWMNETISDSEEPAGKGLFDIDTVYIRDYNGNPDGYLKDKEGNYKYDVLVFGTYDANAGEDLSNAAYNATVAFMDTGRGVLFGHDTVAEYMGNSRMVFRRFGERMGVKMISDGYLVWSNRVKVVNTGFLTSYPWKLTGTLQIPYAHPAGLYADGSLSSTMWLEFEGDYLTDEETGATNGAYLFTKDAIAMIQTGHSNGEATDDERRILANTLFYLKQFTDKTSARDNSFYDEEAPEKPDVTEEDGKAVITAKDRGTAYEYYVEGVNQNPDCENVKSNTIHAEAESGIRGYVVAADESGDPAEGMLVFDEEGNLQNEVIPAENGTASYDLCAYKPGQTVYLHVYAVDNAGNISEEKIQEIEIPTTVSDKEYLKQPYALFASDEDVQMYCSEANVSGDIYGQNSFCFQGSTLHIPDRIETAGKLSIAGGVLDIGEQIEDAEGKSMPDYMPVILKDMEAGGDSLEEMNAYNSTDIVNPTHCMKTTGAWCNDVKIQASLVSGGKISLNANTVTCGKETPVVLGSENGDIHIQATRLNGNGLIYAPNGTVTIEVSEMNYTGTIIARKIRIQAGYVNLNQ